MKYIRSIIAGLLAVAVTFTVPAIVMFRSLAGFLWLFWLVALVRPFWLIVAGVFLGGFIFRLWTEDRLERKTDVSTTT
jgi:hypothetical protein